jgi:hypothetical protein
MLNKKNMALNVMGRGGGGGNIGGLEPSPCTKGVCICTEDSIYGQHTAPKGMDMCWRSDINGRHHGVCRECGDNLIQLF